MYSVKATTYQNLKSLKKKNYIDLIIPMKEWATYLQPSELIGKNSFVR